MRIQGAAELLGFECSFEFAQNVLAESSAQWYFGEPERHGRVDRHDARAVDLQHGYCGKAVPAGLEDYCHHPVVHSESLADVEFATEPEQAEAMSFGPGVHETRMLCQ